jgi:pyrimidine operon attenuation protein/uracil phosphoribosyltransferase
LSPRPPGRQREKAQVLDEAALDRALTRIAHEILEKNDGSQDLAFVGLRTRGVTLAQRLAAKIARIDGATLPVGTLDITLYRDDLSLVAPKPVVKESRFPEDLDERVLVLCDDVLYTGRTVRAALDALVDFGRPKAVRLAVLIDRGWRELPIHADFVGRKVPTSASEVIKVSFESTDGVSKVQILDRPA